MPVYALRVENNPHLAGFYVRSDVLSQVVGSVTFWGEEQDVVLASGWGLYGEIQAMVKGMYASASFELFFIRKDEPRYRVHLSEEDLAVFLLEFSKG